MWADTRGELQRRDRSALVRLMVTVAVRVTVTVTVAVEVADAGTVTLTNPLMAMLTLSARPPFRLQ